MEETVLREAKAAMDLLAGVEVWEPVPVARTSCCYEPDSSSTGCSRVWHGQ